MSDRLLIAVTKDGRLRARAVAGTELVQNAVRPHQPTPLATRAIGRAALCAALFPLSWKEIDRIALQWSGSGPLGSVVADLREGNLVRAMASNSSAALAPQMSYAGRRGIGYGLLPQGFLSVIRQRPSGHFDRGQVALRNGEIDEDLEEFFLKSDQTATRVRCHVDVDDAGGDVRAASGVIVQALPGKEAAVLPACDLDADELASATPEELLDRALDGQPWKLLETRHPTYRCTCTEERFAAGLLLLESEELLEMINEDEGARLHCDFCTKLYEFNREQLESLFAYKVTQERAKKPPESGDGEG